MPRLLQKPRVKILTLCVCLGLATVRRRLRLARGTRAGLLRTRQGAISRRRITSKPASSSATPSSAKPTCCRPGRRSPRSTSRSRTCRRSPGPAPDHRTCTKRSRRHDQAGADLSVGGGNALDQALKLANKAGEIDPKNTDVLALKAAILFKLKDTDGAARAAQEALAIDPQHTGANVVARRRQAFARRCRRRAESAGAHIERSCRRPRRDLSEDQYFQPEGRSSAGRSRCCAN